MTCSSALWLVHRMRQVRHERRVIGVVHARSPEPVDQVGRVRVDHVLRADLACVCTPLEQELQYLERTDHQRFVEHRAVVVTLEIEPIPVAEK